MAHILIIGCGDVGQRLGGRLVAAGHAVTGVRRTPPAEPGALAWRAADITRAADVAALPDRVDQLVFMVAPTRFDPALYEALYGDGLPRVLERYAGAGGPAWIFVSSTSVYGQDDGAWIDEDSPTEPTGANGRCLLAAERRVLAADPRHAVVRFSGIYGPGREMLLERVRAGAPVRRTPPRYGNRIHADDCAGVLEFLIAGRLAGRDLPRVLLATDDDPAPAGEVADWLAERLGVPRPPAGETVSPFGGSKRCRNARLRGLGCPLAYPTFREGYAAVLAAADRHPGNEEP